MLHVREIFFFLFFSIMSRLTQPPIPNGTGNDLRGLHRVELQAMLCGVMYACCTAALVVAREMNGRTMRCRRPALISYQATNCSPCWSRDAS